ncbi:IS66 family transposase [Vibrio mediterranei]
MDDYQGYTDASLVGYWAHARRKFIDAEKVQTVTTVGCALL